MVPNIPHFEEVTFDTETTLVIGAAYDKACRELGLSAATDSIRTRIADKIMEIARRGERDPKRLCLSAICALV